MCRSNFSLRKILDQSIKWNTTLYANFIDFAKTFDSVHHPALWKILMHYGIPNKIISIIQMLYKDFHVAKVSGEGDERPRMDLGHGTGDVCRQAEMEILGEGLMCPRHEEDKVSK